jgi:hypothetical protein
MVYKLTKRRLDAAEPILEKYRSHLHKSRHMQSMVLERELRDCWGIGYQELKDIIIDLAKTDRYRLVAAYYMQHQNAPGPVSEFQKPLADLYGTPHYDPFDKDGKQKAFWENAFAHAEEEP